MTKQPEEGDVGETAKSELLHDMNGPVKQLCLVMFLPSIFTFS